MKEKIEARIMFLEGRRFSLEDLTKQVGSKHLASGMRIAIEIINEEVAFLKLLFNQSAP